MSSLRIRGAETFLTIMSGSGDVQNNLTDIQSFNATIRFEKLEARYLGEEAPRTDEIYNGCEGKVKMHLHSQDFVSYILGIQSRARRITPTSVFNFISTMNFPNGETPSLTFPDVNFGNVPIDTPGAKEYVSLDLDWICSEFDIQTT